jgi:hypothetical protein
MEKGEGARQNPKANLLGLRLRVTVRTGPAHIIRGQTRRGAENIFLNVVSWESRCVEFLTGIVESESIHHTNSPRKSARMAFECDTYTRAYPAFDCYWSGDAYSFGPH